MSKAYEARYSEGTRVRIRPRADLEEFVRTWRYHHKLTDEHLTHAGEEALVASVGFYHGGDPLYELEGIPGFWHEENLQQAS